MKKKPAKKSRKKDLKLTPLISIKRDKIAEGVPVPWIRSIVAGVLAAEKSKKLFVSVLLTNNKEIRAINKKFLKHDYATDVISFEPGSGYMAGPETDYLGDVVASVDMAQSVARDLGIPWREELARYLVHGTLHLLGYDDHAALDRDKMMRRQEELVTKLAK